MRLATLAPLVIAAALPFARPAAAQGEFHWKGQLAAGKTIEIKGVNGDIDAVAGSGEVEVTAVKHAHRSDPDEVKIEVVQHEDGVTICAVYPSDGARENTCETGEHGHMSTHDNDVRVNFTVRVPAGVRFVGHTVNGEVEAANLSGDVEAHSVNGSIRVSTSGSAEASTVNGSITASMGRAQWTDALEFHTVNGGITLNLPANVSTEVRASTVNGDIETDFPLMVTGRLGPRRVTGTIGSGGRRLALETASRAPWAPRRGGSCARAGAPPHAGPSFALPLSPWNGRPAARSRRWSASARGHARRRWPSACVWVKRSRARPSHPVSSGRSAPRSSASPIG